MTALAGGLLARVLSEVGSTLAAPGTLALDAAASTAQSDAAAEFWDAIGSPTAAAAAAAAGPLPPADGFARAPASRLPSLSRSK